MGAQTQFDVKNERYIVNGCHDAGRMQDMLDGFIKKFVLCEKCENPETVLKVKKNMIGASCKACGHIFTLDMRHKLTTFIIKNPPEKEIDSQVITITSTIFIKICGNLFLNIKRKSRRKAMIILVNLQFVDGGPVF